jgi:NADPH:quinone reductase-like Zn-dependent oxidoreductase
MGLLPNFIAARPSIVGADFAGIVADPNNSDFQLGEHVFGWNPMCKSHPRFVDK